MRYLSILAILLLATSVSSVKASVIISSGPIFPDPVEEGDPPNFESVIFSISSKGLYRPSGSQPWDEHGLGNASISMTLAANLDEPLEPLEYEGKDSLYAEVSGTINLRGRRDAPHSVEIPIHAAVVFSPSELGTDLFLKVLSGSGSSPRSYGSSQTVYGSARDEFGKTVFAASFTTAGGKSTYGFDYKNVVSHNTLRVLTDMASERPIDSRALAVSRVGIGFNRVSYLTERPGEKRPLWVFFSETPVPVPVPEPNATFLALVAGLTVLLKYRVHDSR